MVAAIALGILDPGSPAGLAAEGRRMKAARHAAARPARRLSEPMRIPWHWPSDDQPRQAGLPVDRAGRARRGGARHRGGAAGLGQGALRCALSRRASAMSSKPASRRSTAEAERLCGAIQPSACWPLPPVDGKTIGRRQASWQNTRRHEASLSLRPFGPLRELYCHGVLVAQCLHHSRTGGKEEKENQDDGCG